MKHYNISSLQKILFRTIAYIILLSVLRFVNDLDATCWQSGVLLIGISIMLAFFVGDLNDLRAIKLEARKNAIYKEFALKDTLTGIGSRYAFYEYIQQYKRYPLPKTLAVFYIDVNKLKQINDTLGHDAGDEVIIGAARCVQAAFGEDGECFRIGGDEFCIVLNVNPKTLKRITENFEHLTSCWTGELVDHLSVSYGFARAIDNPELTLENLITKADECMYLNKQFGFKQEII